MATSIKKTTKSATKKLTDGSKGAIYGTSGDDYLYGTAGNDTIYGLGGNDTFISSPGDDYLDGGDGMNKFIYKIGSGNDTIANSTGKDTLAFSYHYDLRFSRDMNNNDLKLSYGNNGDSITFQDYYVNNSHSVNKIINGNEGYYLSGVTSRSQAVINNYGIDITGTSGNDVINGGDADDTVMAGDGNDTITGGHGNDTLNGGAGNNTLVFYNNCGNDVVERSTGNDTIKFNSQQNLQFVRDMSNQNLVINYGNNDSITVEGFYNNNSIYNVYAELWADSYNNHSLKNIQNGNTTKTVKGTMNQYGVKILGTDNGEQIFGSKGADTIYGGGGDDSIVSYAGNDYLDGGAGNDNYIFYNYSYGDKTIANSIGNDKVTICDPSHGFDFRFSRDMSNNDLKLTYKPDISNNTTGTITLKDYYVPAGHSVKQIVNNITTKTVTETIDQWGIDITGTSNNDTIYGSKSNDSIYGGDGNDNISGGLGDDTLDGGLGSDFYYFNTGSGNDTILNNTGYGKDVLVFFDQQDLSFSRSAANKDLVVSYGDNDSITLKDYYATAYHAVKFIKNGGTAQYEAIGDVVSGQEVTYNGTSGSDLFKAALTDNVRIVDAGGSDELRIAQDANALAGVNILFNVDSTGNNLSDIRVLSSNQLADWASGNDVAGVKIANNAVETIYANHQQITSTDIAQLAADVAGWLNTNGYACVQDVINSNDTADINSMMAVFQNNANWQPA